MYCTYPSDTVNIWCPSDSIYKYFVDIREPRTIHHTHIQSLTRAKGLVFKLRLRHIQKCYKMYKNDSHAITLEAHPELISHSLEDNGVITWVSHVAFILWLMVLSWAIPLQSIRWKMSMSIEWGKKIGGQIYFLKTVM